MTYSRNSVWVCRWNSFLVASGDGGCTQPLVRYNQGTGIIVSAIYWCEDVEGDDDDRDVISARNNDDEESVRERESVNEMLYQYGTIACFPFGEKDAANGKDECALPSGGRVRARTQNSH